MTDQDGAIPLTETALKLGISTEVLRKRLSAGVVKGHKVGNRWYVPLGQDGLSGRQPNGHQDGSGRHPDASGTHPDDSYRLLSASQKDEIEFLRSELSARTEELRRKDILLADFSQRLSEITQRLPELPATTDSTEQPGERPAGRGVPDASRSARPWWKFWVVD